MAKGKAPPLGKGGGKVVVDFPRLQCPGCGGYGVTCDSTQWPVRYHHCEGCGMRFESYDRGPQRRSKYEEEEAVIV
jgi:hypothetical protein